MSPVVSALAILGGLVAAAAVIPSLRQWRAYAPRAAVFAGLLGVLVGGAAMYLEGATELSLLVATAACAGLVVVPPAAMRPPRAPLAVAVGGLIPLVGGLMSLFVEGSADTGGQASLLFAAQAAAVVAACVSALVGATFSDRAMRRQEASGVGVGPSLPLAVISLCAGALWVGHARGGPVGTGWSLPLRAGGEPVEWKVPGVSELPQGLSIDAVLQMPALTVLVALALFAALFAALLPLVRPGQKKRARIALIASGALSLVAGLVASLVGSRARLPDDETPYAEAARALMPDGEEAEAAVGEGSFSAAGEQIYVAVSDLLPDLTLLGVAGLLGGLVGAYLLVGHNGEGADELDERRDGVIFGLSARDYMLRAVSLGWLAWLVAVLVHWQYYGALGVGSPAEWSAIGVLLTASGVALIGWRRRDHVLLGWARRLGPALIFALFVAGLTTALVFDAPFGVSMVF